MTNLQKFFKDKRVLITGHTGFKGSWLSQILLLWGADVTGIALKPATEPNLFDALKIKNKTNNYFIDIRDLRKIRSVFVKHKPEIVFHLAAQPIVRASYDDPLYTFETNIIGTANVLEAVRDVKSVCSAVMITTDKVYENKETKLPYKEDDKLGGHDPYSSSKASAELVINSYSRSFFNPDNYRKTHHTLVASARAGNVIGGGDWANDRIMTDLVRSVFESGQKLSIRNPKAIRPWQLVLEPLAGYLILAKNLYEGHREICGAWNFGPGDDSHIMVKDLLNEAIDHLGQGSYVVEKDFDNKHEATLLKLDSSKAGRYLGWRSFISTSDALRLTLEWYKKFYDKGDIVRFTNSQIKDFFKKYAR